MLADGVHGNIEWEFKCRVAVYDFNVFKDVIAKFRQNIEVIEVKKSLQWLIKKCVPRKTDKDPINTFVLNPIVEANFICGFRMLTHKIDFEESYKEITFLVQKFNYSFFFPLANNIPRGIKTSKKGNVSKLVPTPYAKYEENSGEIYSRLMNPLT